MKTKSRSVVVRDQKPLDRVILKLDPTLPAQKVREIHTGIDKFLADGLEAGDDIAIVKRGERGEIRSVRVLEIFKERKPTTWYTRFLRSRKDDE